MKDKIEEILRNRILYIGDEIPEAFTTDKRSKQLYLGSPAELISELENLFDTLATEVREGLIEKIDNIMDSERAKDIGDQLEAFTGQRSCKMCGFDPEHQRKYILEQLQKGKENI